MKVRELIEKLQELSPDFDITVDGATIKKISKCTDVENANYFM